MAEEKRKKEDLEKEIGSLKQIITGLETALAACLDSADQAKKNADILDAILNGISEGVFLVSKDFRIVWANKALLQETGCAIKEVVGKHCYAATHRRNSPCTPPHDACPLREVMDAKGPITAVHKHFDRDGNEKFVEVTAYPLRDEKGNVTQFVHISRDITERMEMEEALKESEASYRTIFDSANDGIFLQDIETFDIIDVNKRGCEMFFYPCDELKGRGMADLIAREESMTGIDALEMMKRASGGEPALFNCVAKDKFGRTFPIEINLKRAVIGKKYCLLAVVRDISERGAGV